MRTKKLVQGQVGLLVIDIQEKLFSQIESSCQVYGNLNKVIKGFKLLDCPIMVTEQYPQGLGSTLPAIKDYLGPTQQYYSKTTFSCLGEESIRKAISDSKVKQWVLVGLEAHVCILQTARDLLTENYDVVVLNDAISSRSIFDYSTAIAELRDSGARISSVETVLFELLKDSKAPQFKEISQLIQTGCCEQESSHCQ